jgi:hypothetical protein
MSEFMVDRYNAVARKSSYSINERHAVQGDLLADSPDSTLRSASLKSEEFFHFDIIIMSISLYLRRVKKTS